MHVGVHKVQGGSVIDGKAWRDLARVQELMVRGTTGCFAVIVGTAAPRQEPETLEWPQCPGEGISHPLLEPANGASADPCENDARGPGFPQERWQLPVAPDGQHALGVATSDVDHVLGQQICPKVRGPAEER